MIYGEPLGCDTPPSRCGYPPRTSSASIHWPASDSLAIYVTDTYDFVEIPRNHGITLFHADSGESTTSPRMSKLVVHI